MEIGYEYRASTSDGPGDLIQGGAQRCHVSQRKRAHDDIGAPVIDGKLPQVCACETPVKTRLAPGDLQHFRAKVHAKHARSSCPRLNQPAARSAARVQEEFALQVSQPLANRPKFEK